MPWPDLVAPPMRRVALVAPADTFRRAAVAVAGRGTFEPDLPHDDQPGPITTVVERLTHDPGLAVEPPPAELSSVPLQPDRWAELPDGATVSTDDLALLLGEAEYEHRTAGARRFGRCIALPGWIRAEDADACRSALDPLGGALVDLPGRPGAIPPTDAAAGRGRAAFRPLVTTYATVPYRDLDPTWFAAASYLVMFGMMFGDVAHGLAIVLIGALAIVAGRRATGDGPPAGLARLARVGPFLVGAGVSAAAFGVAYGEAFGPTGLVPTLWIRPLDEPQTLLVVGLAVGAVLTALVFAGATVNRFRSGGLVGALYDPSGIAGSLLLLGTGAIVLAVAGDVAWALPVGGTLATIGAALVFVGLFVDAGAGASGAAQAVVELFDTVLRLGSNLVSFTRLAAFGLTHAVITEVVWDGTTAWWGTGPVATVGAVVLFVGGNLAAFALGALVAAIQALRLEYYELFSRLFTGSGRPFDPWSVPVRKGQVT